MNQKPIQPACLNRIILSVCLDPAKRVRHCYKRGNQRSNDYTSSSQIASHQYCKYQKKPTGYRAEKKQNSFPRRSTPCGIAKKLSIESAKNNQITHQCVMLSCNKTFYYRNSQKAGSERQRHCVLDPNMTDGEIA